jgi:hypothetical protein
MAWWEDPATVAVVIVIVFAFCYIIYRLLRRWL